MGLFDDDGVDVGFAVGRTVSHFIGRAVGIAVGFEGLNVGRTGRADGFLDGQRVHRQLNFRQ